MANRLQGQPNVLVVGGGTAGCVLAARLSDDPHRSVVLLEAGRDLRSALDLPPVLVGHPPASVRALPDTWRYDAELTAAPRRTMSQFRGRVLGGSSSINGSLFMRGIPEDYAAWGSTLWTFDQVLPSFRRLEHDLDFQDEFHGADGPLRVARGLELPLTASQQRVWHAARAAGIAPKADLNHPTGSGIGHVPMVRDTRSTALAYLAPVRARPNLTVLSDVLVTRIVFDGRTAVGVELVRDGQVTVLHADEIVLSSGTFGSPHVLLKSGVGPADQLQRLGVPLVEDLPGVGHNMRCHPMVTVRLEADSETPPDPEFPRLVIVHSVAERNDVMIFPKQLANSLAIMVTLRLPSGAGNLRLSSPEPSVLPTLHYGYLQPDDLSALRAGVCLALDLAQRVHGGAADVPSDAWLLEHLETADHACGTCKLGPAHDPFAVVDETCRVHGLDGLRVVDLSIVPRPVRAGPYPTVVMLAERAADLMCR